MPGQTWRDTGHKALCPVSGVGRRCHLADEGMRGSPEPPVGGERDGAKLDVEPLVSDDLVGGLVLGLGVDVGGGTTCSLTNISFTRARAISLARSRARAARRPSCS